jgi:hypothetical protein
MAGPCAVRRFKQRRAVQTPDPVFRSVGTDLEPRQK